VLAGHDARDHVLLHAAEVIEAEDAFEELVRVGHLTRRLADRAPLVIANA
jgi:hypothetical protein